MAEKAAEKAPEKAPAKKTFAKKDLDVFVWPPEDAEKDFKFFYPDGHTITYEQRKRSDIYDQMGELELLKLLDDTKGGTVLVPPFPDAVPGSNASQSGAAPSQAAAKGR